DAGPPVTPFTQVCTDRAPGFWGGGGFAFCLYFEHKPNLGRPSGQGLDGREDRKEHGRCPAADTASPRGSAPTSPRQANRPSPDPKSCLGAPMRRSPAKRSINASDRNCEVFQCV